MSTRKKEFLSEKQIITYLNDNGIDNSICYCIWLAVSVSPYAYELEKQKARGAVFLQYGYSD